MALTEDRNVTYVCDNEGKKIGVVLSTERYEKLLEFERIVKHIYKEVSGTDNVGEPDHSTAESDISRYVTQTTDNENNELFLMPDSISDASTPVSDPVSASSDNMNQNRIADHRKRKETDSVKKDSEDIQSDSSLVNSDPADLSAGSSGKLSDAGSVDTDSGLSEQTAVQQLNGQTDSSAVNTDSKAPQTNSENDTVKDDPAQQHETAEAAKETKNDPAETMATSENSRKSGKSKKIGITDSCRTASDPKENNSSSAADKKQKAKKSGTSSENAANKTKTRTGLSEITVSASSPEETVRLMDEMKLIKKFNLESVIVNDVPHIKFKYASTKPGTKNIYESYGYFTYINSRKCFVVMKGSLISKNCADSVRNTVKEERNRLIKDGIVTETEDALSLCYNSSVPYNSPSLAASVISGSNRSGFDAWRASNGLIMKKLIEDGIEQADTEPYI